MLNNFSKQMIRFLLLACVFAFMLSPASTLAESKENLVEKGNALFADGKYEEALNAYNQAAVTDPESPYIFFNKGAALYKKESYAAAREAFQKAALKSKDIDLEANARFNSGLCSFREGERQKDSDLTKTLEAYEASAASFQEALDLDAQFSEAAENIEMVRLMMKSVLDEIKKQEEAAKKQQEQMQQTAEKIKQLIQKQEDLLNRSRAALKHKDSDQKSGNQQTPELSKQNQAIAGAQDQLRQETTGLSTKLAQQQQQQPMQSTGAPANQQNASDHPSRQHLDDSAGEQESAVNRLTDNETTVAAGHQQKSLDALNKALDALAGEPQNQGGGQQQNQSQQGQASDAEKKSDQSVEKNKSGAEQSQESPPEEELEKEQAQAFELADDPESILEEEKENKEHRKPVSAGGFKEVDKDW